MGVLYIYLIFIAMSLYVRITPIMNKKRFVILSLCVFMFSAAPAQKDLPNIPTLGQFSKSDRVLILAPHPDDEVLGCAGIIQEALKAGSQVRVTYLTNGEHNQFAFIVYEKRITLRQNEFVHLGEVRRSESVKSMKSLGLEEDKLTFLGYPDFGTFTIFSRYWQIDKPYKTILTRISSVPYKNNFSYGAPYVGESVLSDLKEVLIRYKPNKIFVSHPADVNGDHRALYLFLQIALLDLKKDLPEVSVYPYLIHCVGWPKPRHYHPELFLIPPKKFDNSDLSWRSLFLSENQLNKKHEAILMHKSQTESSAFYLLSFIRKNELFSDYPEAELKPQDTSKGQALSFSAFSDLYTDINNEDDTAVDSGKDDQGRISFANSDKALFIRLEKEKGFSSKFSFVLYLFGYSEKTPFAKMPKIRIFAKGKRLKSFDGMNLIIPEGASLERNAKAITLKVPLSILGNPDYILASIKTYGGTLPVDATAFRKIRIR